MHFRINVNFLFTAKLKAKWKEIYKIILKLESIPSLICMSYISKFANTKCRKKIIWIRGNQSCQTFYSKQLAYLFLVCLITSSVYRKKVRLFSNAYVRPCWRLLENIFNITVKPVP